MKITRRSKIAASKGLVASSNNINRQREYEYRRNLYLKRKHEFETLGEEGNNDVLSREDKMNIAKAEMDKVAPKSVNSDEEYDVSEWTELASKSVLDSDGFYTDYTLYTNGSTFICMFGDKDIYEPDEMYADYETDDEEAAYSWFDHYEGFSDEDEDNEYDIYGSEDLMHTIKVMQRGPLEGIKLERALKLFPNYYELYDAQNDALNFLRDSNVELESNNTWDYSPMAYVDYTTAMGPVIRFLHCPNNYQDILDYLEDNGFNVIKFKKSRIGSYERDPNTSLLVQVGTD